MTTKMQHRFTVLFSPTLEDTNPHHIKIATALMTALTRECISIQFPLEVKPVHTPFNSVPCADGFLPISTEGPISIVFKDDSTNLVQDALDFLYNQDLINILVCKLSASDHVLEAWVFGRVKVHSVQHSALDFSKWEIVTKTVKLTSVKVQRAKFGGPIGGANLPTVVELSKQIF